MSVLRLWTTTHVFSGMVTMPSPSRLVPFLLVAALFIPVLLHAQQSLLQAGPMLGHIDMQEARIWIQTKSDADVYVTYRDSADADQSFRTQTIRTSERTACTATLVADRVRPGRTYLYDVHINGKACRFGYPTRFRTQPIWKWRPDPPPTYTIALGSCFYVNEEGFERSTGNYGSDYEIMTAIRTKRPDFMLWLGDNTYLREPDWNSRAGILHRYTHTRSLPELQPLLASTAHYAIWDDHDYGPNDADRSWWGKYNTLEAFRLFWCNPSYGVMDRPGITTSFEAGDVQFFLLDDRYYRAANNRKDGERTILGNDQIEWLIDALSSSTATFKIVAVGSQFLTDNVRKECFARMPEERRKIIDMITHNGIKGVLFVSGDIHAAELSKLDRPDTYPLYEFTCSSLTAGANAGINEQSNAFRVPGTAVGQHNFGTVTVSGPSKKRVLTLRVFDKSGQELWNRAITEGELQ